MIPIPSIRRTNGRLARIEPGNHLSARKIPTQNKTDPKNFIKCPTGCTQRRGRKNNLLESKTYDIRRHVCKNCGFSKIGYHEQFTAKFVKASQL